MDKFQKQYSDQYTGGGCMTNKGSSFTYKNIEVIVYFFSSKANNR